MKIERKKQRGRVLIDRQIDNQIDKYDDRQIDRQIDRQVSRKIDTQMDTQIGRKVDTQIDTQMDTQIGRKIDTQIDTQMDEQMGMQSGIENTGNFKNLKRDQRSEYILVNALDNIFQLNCFLHVPSISQIFSYFFVISVLLKPGWSMETMMPEKLNG